MSKLTLCVFIDAFGWELRQRHAFIDDVCEHRGPLETVFGYSSTCDPTILTGKWPREHGHFSFFAYDPSRSPFGAIRWLKLLPRSITSRGRVRHWISKLYRARLGYTGYFQLYNVPFDRLPSFDYTEKRDLYEPNGINGNCETVFDRLRAHGVRYSLSDWRRPEEPNLESLHGDIDRGEISFAYLYLASMDAVLHAQGTKAPAVSDKIAWYDSRLREVLDRAHARYDDVSLHVFSDHGMTDITGTCSLIERIDATGLTFGVDYGAMYDSTMARFWFLRDGARERIEKALSEEPRGAILSDENLAAWGCDFPDRRYGDLFFLLDPGVLLCPSYMGEKPLAGMHGFAPDHRDSVAMYMTNTGHRPTGLVDLFDVMTTEAGVAKATAAAGAGA